MPRPDVVFVVLDTLRADRLSCYGHPEATTPHLDEFAASGTLFERAISPAQWTIPAHGSLFTGTYPSYHGTTQIYDKHSPAVPTLAEYLSQAGYRTAGFCNNPLLGVVENDLDRGFAEFYNYGGVLPNRPDTPAMTTRGRQRSRAVRKAANWIRAQLRRVAAPIEALFTHDHKLLNVAFHPWLVALWERQINFKGNTRQSIQDLVGYLAHHHSDEAAPPLFVYLNLMETHLPYRTPPSFSRRFAPSFHQEDEAHAFMQAFNHRTYDWIAPITRPFSPLQHRVLNEMYNAELAYEDHLLAPLLRYLDRPEIREDTLVVITSDHGEGMDHHGYVGHSLVAYEDLLRVPLIVRYPPRFPVGARVTAPVSTRRVFHTVLEAANDGRRTMDPSASLRAGDGRWTANDGPRSMDDRRLTLWRAVEGEAEVEPVWAEVYPPLTMVRLVEERDPEAVAAWRCRAVRRAIYDGTRKLITVDDEPEEVYDVARDPEELTNRIADEPELAGRLSDALRALVARAQAEGPEPPPSAGTPTSLTENRRVSERLRRLGYIE